MSNSRLIDEVVGIGTTNAGSTVTLISSTPPNDINTLAFAWVLASAAGDERASWLRAGTVHKDSGGTITLDSETDVFPSFSTNGIKHSTIAVVATGGTISLQATGDPAAGDINWQAIVRYFRS